MNPNDLGLMVIELDGNKLYTREYTSGYEQVWVETNTPSEYTLLYCGRYYIER